MKINKKVVVSSLSTTMALSFVAALSGTVAWYQFNTRVSTTLIGTNVASSGVLQIKRHADGEDGWRRDLVTEDLVGHEIKLTPVTFGALEETGALPASAHKKPAADSVWDQAEDARDAYDPDGYAAYENAVANEDYIQYTVDIKAMQSGSQVAKDVYLSDITFADVDGKIATTLRAHLAIDSDGDGNADIFKLISKNEVNDLEMYGYLDLNGDGIADRKGGAEWVANREKTTIYGNIGDKQSTIGAATLQASRDGEGAISGQDEKILFTTLTNKPVTVTVTLWIEGWDKSVVDPDNNEFHVDSIKILGEKYYVATDIKDVTNFDTLGSARYKLDNQNFVKVFGKAKNVAEVASYYSLVATDVTSELNPGDPIQGVLFTKDGDNYNRASGNVLDATQYYSVVPTNENANIVRPSDLDARLATLYELVNNNYIKTVDNNETYDSGKEYYERLNAEASTYNAVENTHDSLADDFSKNYVKDSDNNYVKVSTFNLKGAEDKYYVLKSTSYNPYLSTFADDAFAVTGLYVYNVDHYEAAVGNNVSGTSYYVDEFGFVEARFNDLPSDNYADISGLNLYTVDAKGIYTAVTSGGNVQGTEYYTLLGTEGANPVLSKYPSGLFSVEGLFIKNPSYDVGTYDVDDPSTYEYIAATGTNVAGVDYYATNAGGEKLKLSDLELLSGKVDLANIAYLKDADEKFIPISVYNIKGETYYSFVDGGVAENVATWSGKNSVNTHFHFGLTFDVGSDAFEN